MSQSIKSAERMPNHRTSPLDRAGRSEVVQQNRTAAALLLRLQRQVGNRVLQRLVGMPSNLARALTLHQFSSLIQRGLGGPERHVVVGAGAQTPTKSVGKYGEILMEMLEADKKRELSIAEAVKQAANANEARLKSVAPTFSEAGSGNVVAGQGTKLALIVTNTKYDEPEEDLESALTDGQRMEGILRGRGYATTRVTDQSAAEMEALFGRFVELGVPQDDIVIFYSGHGETSGMKGVDNNTIAPSVVAKWQKEAIETGFQLTLIIEACHSGSTTDFLRNEEITRIERDPRAAGPTIAVLMAETARQLQAIKDNLAALERAKQGLMEEPLVNQLIDAGTHEKEIEKHNTEILKAWTAALPKIQKYADDVKSYTGANLEPPAGPFNEEWLNTKQLDVLDAMTNKTLELAREALARR
jgi:hypothetical protein